MSIEMQETIIPKFPLRLTPDVRQSAEQFSAREGLSLNQFINLAIAEKLDHLRHREWETNRQKPTKELAARALALLEKNRGRPVVPGDELPEDYIPSR